MSQLYNTLQKILKPIMSTNNEMKNTIPNDQTHNPSFPLEIIIEILSRLPVKSLLKFKSVSKSWLSLISSTYFSKSHLNISSRNNKLSHKNLLLLSMYLPHTLYSCTLYSTLHEKSNLCVNKLSFPWNPSNIIAGVSLCNGLFLICIGMYNNNLYLWNPSTRKNKILPFSSCTKYSRCDVTYGFGYDESNHDFKVVEIFGVYGVHYVYGANIKIYSLRSNSWKNMKKYSNALFSSDSGVFLDGCVHWAVAHNDGSCIYWDIVSLNLENEKFGKLTLPSFDGFDGFDGSRLLRDSCDFELGTMNWSLGKLGDFLCLFCDYYKVKLDVWIMKEYNAEGCWMKSVSLPCVKGVGPCISPLWISDIGDEVLLHDGTRVMVYDSRNDEYKRVEICEMNGDGVGAATVYAESLVSPYLDSVR